MRGKGETKDIEKPQGLGGVPCATLASMDVGYMAESGPEKL
jgi:hypothetical protein